jgi:hypothetical protein
LPEKASLSYNIKVIANPIDMDTNLHHILRQVQELSREERELLLRGIVDMRTSALPIIDFDQQELDPAQATDSTTPWTVESESGIAEAITLALRGVPAPLPDRYFETLRMNLRRAYGQA